MTPLFTFHTALSWRPSFLHAPGIVLPTQPVSLTYPLYACCTPPHTFFPFLLSISKQPSSPSPPVDSPLLQFLDLCGQYDLKSEEEEEEVLKEVKARVEADPTLVNARDDVGNSSLSFAAFAGNPKIVYLLVQKGASVNTSNSVVRPC